MLAAIGFITTLVLLILILSKKVHPAIAFIVVPIIAGVIYGVCSGSETIAADLVSWITSGITGMAATGVMFIFSVEFFGIMGDAGAFDPIVNAILKFVKNDPVRVTIGTALLGMACHLDGSGATTFLIAIPPLLPIYDKLGMRRLTLASIVGLAAGTMNIVPWGGPTIRAATAIEAELSYLYNPLIIPQLAGLAFVLLIAVLLGRKETARLGVAGSNTAQLEIARQDLDEEALRLRRPKMVIPNLILIIAAVVVLLEGTITPYIVFMAAFSIGLVMNYPNLKDQGERINAHAVDAMLMASIMFSSAVFTGILSKSGMLAAMTEALVSVMPTSMGKLFPVIVGVLSMPLSLVFDTASFYQGVLPVLASTAEAFGVEGVNVARAAVLGQMTTGFPCTPLTGSTFLLIGLSGVSLADHQKKMIPLAFATTIVMLVVALVIGSIQI